VEVSHALDLFILANCAVVVAAMVQTPTGMGFAMIAAPFLALVSIDFVPGPMLFINLFLSVFVLGDEKSHVVRREIATLAPTILAGTLIGAPILSRIPGDRLAVVFAVLILLAVAISIFARALPFTTRNLSVCGVAVGVMGSTSGIPGAPLVIMYQNEPLEKTRPTMALVFSFSYVTSLCALAWVGAFKGRLAIDGLMLLPGLLTGYGLGRWSRGFMTQEVGRILMLSIASIGAVLLIVKSVAA